MVQKCENQVIIKPQVSHLTFNIYPMKAIFGGRILYKTLDEPKTSENIEISRPDFLEGDSESECASIPDQQSSYRLIIFRKYLMFTFI